jgi:trigger factor
MKADTREKLEKAAVAKADNEMKSNVLEKVYEANDIDVPEVMIANEQDNMMSEFSQQLSQQGLDINTYFQYIGKDAKEFREEIKEDALKRVKTRLIVNKIAEQEGFEVADEEITEEIEKMAAQYGLEADKLREMMGVEAAGMITGDIKVRKALDFIYDSAVKK